jgi:hypothetical protein
MQDDDTRNLSDIVHRLYMMLLLTGSIRLFERPCFFTGHSIEPNQISEISPPYWLDGMPPLSVHWPEIHHANKLRKSLTEMEQSGGYKRLLRVLSIHYYALSSQSPEERLHDFCRCIEGLLLTDKGQTTKQFCSRTIIFVGTNHRTYMRRLYDMRGLIEHLQTVSFSDWPTIKHDRQLIIWEAALVAEAISRYCIERIISNRNLWKHFIEDDALISFWALTEAQQRADWGEALSLSAVRRRFNPGSVQFRP